MNTGSERPRVVIDTNVYISALNFGGKPAQILIREKAIKVHPGGGLR